MASEGTSSESDSDSSEGDSVPLAMLGKTLRPPAPESDDDSEENEFDGEDDDESEDEGSAYSGGDDDDDDEGSGGGDMDVEGEDQSDDSDDSDDEPLSTLRSPTKKVTPAKKTKPPTKSKRSAEKKKAAAKKKNSTKKKKKSEPAKKSGGNGSAILLASTELYAKCEKGKLIQSLLCRWWYAITWPDMTTIPSSPPENYDALDGFPGVFVCTQGDDVGKIMDFRDKETCPNFVNYAKKSSEELRDLLEVAIERQKEVLIEAEGQGTQTEKELIALAKWAKKLNTSKADREATKVLKAAKLTLPS